jgi:hypothetical protein
MRSEAWRDLHRRGTHGCGQVVRGSNLKKQKKKSTVSLDRLATDGEELHTIIIISLLRSASQSCTALIFLAQWNFRCSGAKIGKLWAIELALVLCRFVTCQSLGKVDESNSPFQLGADRQYLGLKLSSQIQPPSACMTGIQG